MNKTLGWFVMCSWGLLACNVEHFDDCRGDDDDDDYGDVGGSHTKAGSASQAGKGEGRGGDGNYSMQEPGEAGVGAGPTSPRPEPCTEERDCAPGYNCNLEVGECQAADEETCGELMTEAACTHRTDCTPIYAGINCSCGQDCECKGGEPGCVCESFDFFVCQVSQ